MTPTQKPFPAELTCHTFWIPFQSFLSCYYLFEILPNSPFAGSSSLHGMLWEQNRDHQWKWMKGNIASIIRHSAYHKVRILKGVWYSFLRLQFSNTANLLLRIGGSNWSILRETYIWLCNADICTDQLKCQVSRISQVFVMSWHIQISKLTFIGSKRDN